LIARSKLGYLGVLADHAPIIAALADGKITATDDSGKTNIFDSKGGGFLEVVKNKAVILLFAH
jgi:F0F1-type ATP synthase epsilon subunit